jgi:hypothetical protein
MYLVAENQELKDRLNRIEEQLRQNSQNSSKPLSRWLSEKGLCSPGKKARKKNEVLQPGHSGHEMKFYDLSASDIRVEHRPSICRNCGPLGK